jgi:flagellar motor protein MotB
MTTRSQKPRTPSRTPAEEQEAIVELRRLLFGSDRELAQRLRVHLERVEPDELGRVLPTAIRLRNAQDQVLTDALMPTVATALRIAVKRDPQSVAAAIFPVMAPAIRHAIATAFSQMVQTIDKTLEHSLSWQGLKWRYESWKTGRTFGEIVLYHTLLYRVEHVFLIHRENGLLLDRVSAQGLSEPSAEIISSMMTAIKTAWQDFAHDSFGTAPDAVMSTVRIGECEIWFEQGPALILACVIRGEAPEELRSEFLRPAIEAIHREQAEEISRFNGDPSPFILSRRHLESCLQARLRREERENALRLSPRILVPLVVVLVALGVWGFFYLRDNWRWQSYLSRLEAEPGIVITETGKRDGKFFVAGMHDPLATDPRSILGAEGMPSSGKVLGHWTSYQALEPVFVLNRAKSVLQPPPTVEMNLSAGALSVKGSASREWIDSTRRLARAIPGVSHLVEDGLIDDEILRVKAQMEQEVPRFIVGTARFVPGEQEKGRQLVADARKLFDLARTGGVNVRVEVVGHTDETGTTEFNDRLSQERAETVRSLLVTSGIEAERLSAIGVGTRQPVAASAGTLEPEVNRSVTFRVAVDAVRKQN